jgi:MFS family permease
MNDRRLFWACFLSLIATAFGFIIRAMIMDDWAREFDLTETQKGEIFGAGLWPFAISIVLFSLIIDKVGYGKSMIFAFVCHVASVIITITAKDYRALYLGNFVVALGNGVVEAVANPVVATLFPKEKTKWLNMLHAGWPGGLVLGGLLTIAMTAAMGADAKWQYKIGLILIPVVGYGVLMLGCKFPVNERVAAGISYRDMLREFGMLGALIIVTLMIREVGRVFALTDTVQIAAIAAIVLGFGAYVMSFGRLMFFFLLLVMIPLATTELGTDSWITTLMEPEMTSMGLQAGWVLVYTSLIMMILRFFAGSIVHRISPLGLLAASSLIAALGLVALSHSTGLTILLAATLYALGKTFFWPTMLGVVAEQFPKGGAMTLNGTGAVGMLGVGVVGAVFLGYIQDRSVASNLQATKPEIYAAVSESKESVFGKYEAVNIEKVKELPAADQAEVRSAEAVAKKSALQTVAIFPCIMLVCYLAMLAYFKSIGGYKADVLAGHAAQDDKFTGGLVAPGEG